MIYGVAHPVTSIYGQRKWRIWSTKMADNQNFQCINKLPLILRKFVKSENVAYEGLLLYPQRTLDLEYQYGGIDFEI